MTEVELYGGINLDEAYEKLKAEAAKNNDVCFARFNGKQILSSDTEDETYKKVMGITKKEFEERLRQWREDWQHRRCAESRQGTVLPIVQEARL